MKNIIVLLFLGMLSSAVMAETLIVDDHFNDGNLATNTSGTGTGFNADGPSESDSKAKFPCAWGWDRPRMTSKDGAAIGGRITRFEFRGVSFAKTESTHTGNTDRIYLGVKGSNTANSMEGNPDTGFWIQIESDSLATGSGNGSWTGTSTLFYESSTDVSTKLVSWKFNTLNWDDNNPATMNFTPVLNFILELDSDGYSLVIEGDTINRLTGSMSGTYAAAGITNQLTTGYAAIFTQGEYPCVSTSIDQIVITKNDCPAGDLDGDCKVNIKDFAVLARNWLVDTRIMPQ